MIGALYAAGLLLAASIGLPLWFRYSRRRYPPMSASELRKLERDGVSARDRLELRDAHLKRQDELRATGVQALVGLAVLSGAILAYQAATADRGLNRQGQASERFTTAIGQLNSKLPEAKLGGIYGLEQIARLAPEENRLPVTEVLVAYLHNRIPKPNKPTRRPEELRIRAPDAQAALTVLGRRQIQRDPPDPRLDLRTLNLRRADLRDADFTRADLTDTVLNEANLSSTDLSGATLHYVDLIHADLTDADLIDADLMNVDLRGANLRHADFSDTDLSKVDLRGATADHETQWPDGFRPQDAGVQVTDP
jgi:hypothetical protein